jgi:hypothetical protein
MFQYVFGLLPFYATSIQVTPPLENRQQKSFMIVRFWWYDRNLLAEERHLAEAK